jgi:hypothetical protein
VLIMAKIGGNILGIIQTKATKKDETGNIVKNEIGEAVQEWSDAFKQIGWLDMQSGSSNYTNFNAKIEESTHVFICDYHSGIDSLQDQDTRMIINSKMYDVLLIDNPMEMNEQLEIYLRKVGGQ